MKTRRSTILHFWNNGQPSSAAVSRVTKTPKYNTTKIKQQSTIEGRPREGRRRKMTASYSIALSQWTRRNNEATSKELLHGRALNVFQRTVQRQLKRMGCKGTSAYATPMLTQEQKHARLQ